MPLLFQVRKVTIGVVLCGLVCAPVSRTQTPQPPARQDTPDVLRVFTELVQTDVMVFNKEGRFVDGLKKEDFELRLDGKPKPIDFFERVTAGTVSEELLLATARGSTARAEGTARPRPLDRGRPIFFYLDDLHLDHASMKTAKELIANYIDKQMGQNDEIAIASASGQLGFLQQLTNHKTVLRNALEKLKFRASSIKDLDRPPMSEYHAMLIENSDREVLSYFVDETLKNNPGMSPSTAESMVRNRSRVMMQQAGNFTNNTLIGLESLVRGTSVLPGRKLVVFISSGFFLDTRNSDAVEKIRRIASAAARSGVVIYSMDARGLSGGLPDASSDVAFDTSGRLQRANAGELVASQDGMNALAKDTGGRAFFNRNSLMAPLESAIKETSGYYLLAWKPDQERLEANKFRRIEVKVIGKPELTVRVRRGFFDLEPEPLASVSKKAPAPKPGEKTPEAELRKTIASPYPTRALPVSLRLSYFDTPGKGATLLLAMQVPTEFLSFDQVKEKQSAAIGVGGTVFNDQGQAGAGFNKRLVISAAQNTASKENENLVYNHSVFLKPGLYQVRVGARDEKSGRAGTVHDWIEIPDLAKGMALSSLFVSTRALENSGNAAGTPAFSEGTQLPVGYHFSSNDFLRFMLFVYNAAKAPADAKPDVALQIQVLRDGQPVVTAPLKKINVEGVEDLSRIPYAAEVSLDGLPVGQYILQTSVVDRVAKTSAVTQARFTID